MAKKHDLRTQRLGTVINKTSTRQEKTLNLAVTSVQNKIKKKFGDISLSHEPEMQLRTVVLQLRKVYPDVDFHYYHEKSAMRPDGGILYLKSKKDDRKFPILVAEKKNQGTNDLREAEGKKKQAKGNAIERLGKNVIGLRTALIGESIFPFVCFGDGCDFDTSSSIIDRVVTIAMFGSLNKEYVHALGEGGRFNRGTFYFRVAEWTESEMTEKCYSVAEKAVYYYFSKHGESTFR